MKPARLVTVARQSALPLLILLIMFGLMLGSAWNDSPIFDEIAHIPAGFGYVTQFDLRLNPEHPPLMKALAALSAQLIVHPVFPTNSAAWRRGDEWAMGKLFLYESGNDPSRIVFWARSPMMLTTLLLGALLFLFARQRYGTHVAALALVFFAFSPTFLAHGRYVTTDVGVSLGFFVAIVTYVRFLEGPGWKTVLPAGLALGLADLTKFSALLLVPLDALLLSVWLLTLPPPRPGTARRLAAGTLIIGVIGISIIWAVYALLGLNYSLADNYRIVAQAPIPHRHFSGLPVFDLLLSSWLTRPFANFLVGLVTVLKQTTFGDTWPTYFLGTTAIRTSRLYFPVLYLTKEPLALHVLTVLALCLGVRRLLQARTKGKGAPAVARIRNWIHQRFFEFSALTFISLYWLLALFSSLHLGVRHVMPTFPFIYLLVSREVGKCLRKSAASTDAREHLPFKGALVGCLALWLVLGTATSFPYFLSYYNALGGGLRNGYKVAGDSNYDWGQDLIRLRDYVLKHHIHELKLDYFGEASPEYYLGGAFTPWDAVNGPAHGWFAVSATALEDRLETHGQTHGGGRTASYAWLERYQPVARAGSSIFVYRLP